MSSFEKVGGGYSLDLTLDEAHILINLVEQLLELLGEGDFFHHYDSSDPLAQLYQRFGLARQEGFGSGHWQQWARRGSGPV